MQGLQNVKLISSSHTSRMASILANCFTPMCKPRYGDVPSTQSPSTDTIDESSTQYHVSAVLQ